MNKTDFKQIIHPGEKPLSQEDLNEIIDGPIAAGEEQYQKEINKKEFIIDLIKIVDIEVDGIDHADYPDFCNAYISGAWIEISEQEFIKLLRDDNNKTIDISSQLLNNNEKYYRILTEEELEFLNNNHREWVYQKVMDWIY